MTERITNKNLENVLKYYLRACETMHYTPEQLEGACVSEPYASGIYYVTRYVQGKGHIHDLPGFTGSTSNASTSKKEVYNKLQQAGTTLFDISNTWKEWANN
jgi:hypothetical protein